MGLRAQRRTILYAPFIPFIVLFCHVIKTSDADDLRRLSDFVNTLQGACDTSEAIAKLHRLCQVLYNVASLHAETKTRDVQDETMTPAGNEFDQYLSALGFMPLDDGSANAPGLGSDLPPGAINQTSQLGDWFSGNRYMMGLLEEDLSQFNPQPWGAGS